MTAKPTKPLTAKERTVCMPGVDMRERENVAATMVEVDGPSLERIVFKIYEDGSGATHLCAAGSSSKTLCGETSSGRVDVHQTPSSKSEDQCQACRAEASRIRGRVR